MLMVVLDQDGSLVEVDLVGKFVMNVDLRLILREVVLCQFWKFQFLCWARQRETEITMETTDATTTETTITVTTGERTKRNASTSPPSCKLDCLLLDSEQQYRLDQRNQCVFDEFMS